MSTNGLHSSSVQALWTRMSGRVLPPAQGDGPSVGPPVGYERPDPAWRRFWAGERERLGLPPMLTEEEE